MPRALFLFLILFTTVQYSWAADGRTDYDLDDDGLIEINDWADLDEVRNNLDGASLYGSSEGCPADGCVGFELTTDLDFDTNGDGVLDSSDDYWNGGEGWQPIGSNRLAGEAFEGEFHGNGHLVRNLMIARPEVDDQGLFGNMLNATVKELGLSGPLMKIQGRSLVGGLVGYAQGSQIIATFVSGHIDGNGGDIGGLVGAALGTTIVASYVTGLVSAEGDGYIAGLVGYRMRGDVIASMSTANLQISVIGGLVGYSFTGDPNGTYVSYWATDASGQSISYGGTPATLAELQCPTSADNTTCAERTLYEGWPSYKDAQGNAYWDYGTDTELPGLRLQGRLHRDADGDGAESKHDDFPTHFAASVDSDGDGAPDAWKIGCKIGCRTDSGLILDRFPDNAAAAADTDLDGLPDEWNDDCDSACQSASGLTLDDDNDNDGVANSEDAFPVNAAASVDTDNDGQPDAWLETCDSDCQASSGLMLDASLNDTDNDGVVNDDDAFVNNSAASVDTDGDGQPDAWLEACDSDCQASSGLTLDTSLNDTDNDGVVNDEDAFVNNSAASVDTDGDGQPDAWLEACDSDCQASSGLTLDTSLNDTDNDGVINNEDAYPSDPARSIDEDAPEMLQAPEEISVAATGETTLVTLNVIEAQANDNFDNDLDYQVELDGEVLVRNEEQQVSLPSGALTLDWVAVDDAGNRSEPMAQMVKVYPQVRFSLAESISGEPNLASIAISLSGPSPEYPIAILVDWIESDSAAKAADVVTDGDDGVDLTNLGLIIDSAEALDEAALIIPVAADDLVEPDEYFILELASAWAGSSDDPFAMPLDNEHQRHRLVITEANVAPEVNVSAMQDGESGAVFTTEAGDITLSAAVTDVNGGDAHSYQWYTSELPVTPGDQASFSFDPQSMSLGEYSITVVITDDGNPMLSSDEVTFTFTLAAADAPGDGEPGDGGNGADDGDGGGQTPVSPGGSSSSGSSGGGVGLWLLCLLALCGLWRRKIAI